MSWTDLEYRLIKFMGAHRYDARALSEDTARVGLGHCTCGVEMYWCEYDPHFARALIAELGLDQ